MNETFQDENAPINIVFVDDQLLQDITEEYERLADILFKDTYDIGMTDTAQGKFRGPNGETETVMIVKDHLLTEFDKKAKYVQRQEKDYKGDTKTEIVEMQEQLAQAISLKARKGERTDVRQLYYHIESVRSKIKKLSLDHNVVPDLKDAIKAQQEAPAETQQQEEKAWLVKKQKEDPLKAEVENLKSEFIQRYLISKTIDEKNAASYDFIIPFNNKNRLIWDSIILLMAIWNCIETPLDISFEPQSQVSIIIINNVIDLCFYIDIIVAFRTSYLTFDGQEVKEWRKIAINYIFRGTFFLDLLSVLPFDQLIPGVQNGLQILGMLKLIRIKRLPKLIANLDLKADTKAYLELGQVIFFLILFIHLITCAWFFIVKLDSGVWIPPTEIAQMSTTIYTSQDLQYQYITTLHTAVMYFTGNDQLPISTLQLFFGALLIILSYLVNGSIYGYLAVLFRLMFKRGNAEQEHKDNTINAMEKVIFNRELHEQISRYEGEARVKLEQSRELQEFMGMIGNSLQVKVTQKLVFDIFDKNYVLCAMTMNLEKLMKKQNGTDFTSIVMKRLTLKLCNPDDIIVKQGDLTNDIYYIAQGEVSISIADRFNHSYDNFRILEPGDHFGEISAIYGCPRSATAQANDFCTMAVLSKQNYDRLAGEVPEFATEMRKFVLNAYVDDDVKNWAFETLKQLPFLKGLESDKESALLHKIYFSMTRKTLFAGELYMCPGKPIKNLTIIQDGILELYTIIGQKQFPLEQLMRGSILNYRSFFTDDQAQVYARAATKEITLLEMNYDTLLSMTQESQVFDKRFVAHQMLVLNTSFRKHFYPLDYIRVWHEDYMSSTQASVPADVSERASLMKLMVMRRIAEVRLERNKPKLSQILIQSREFGRARIHTRKKLLDLYGHFEEEDYFKEMEQNGKEEEIKVQEEEKEPGEGGAQEEGPGIEGEEAEGGDSQVQEPKDKIFELMKQKLLKSLQKLDEEEAILEKIKERLIEEAKKEDVQEVTAN